MEIGGHVSLVVSLRVPDGVVVAADSLSTAQNIVQVEIDQPMPQGQSEPPTTASVSLPSIAIPFSASSYTQKLMSVHGKYAVAVVGQGIVNNKSLYYHLRQFEIQSSPDTALPALVDDLIAYLEDELLKQFPKYREVAPDEWRPIAFHVNGYETHDAGQNAVTYEVFVGKRTKKTKRDQIGCTIGGEMRIVQKLWELGREDPSFQFQYALMSLQDAIDLCEYYIDTTATFQRFTNKIPSVGGEVDVALLTPFHDFQWIKRKELMKILEKTNAQPDN
jgi:hypothetical protein